MPKEISFGIFLAYNFQLGRVVLYKVIMSKFNPGKIKSLILDMDGVLWRGDIPIIDLHVVFNNVKNKNFHVILATNNSTRTIDQYSEKLARFGVSLSKSQIINSSLATAHYLLEKYPGGGPLFVLGENGLVETLRDSGFHHSEKEAMAVVAGMDRKLTYKKLSQAALLIRSGSEFIGTNNDKTFPEKQGLVPGAGSILAALEAATDQKPIIIGKPAPEMYQIAMERMGTLPAETLVVGDRLETDILGGQALGCKTALVLSGVTSNHAAHQWKPKPDLIVRDLAALLDLL